MANANGLVDSSIAGDKNVTDPRFYVIGDAMSPLRHMGDGKMYDSKQRFREATKATGNVEIGNDSSLYKTRKPIPLSREKRREDIRKTIYNLRNGIKD
jgi:hypothetical protein